GPRRANPHRAARIRRSPDRPAAAPLPGDTPVTQPLHLPKGSRMGMTREPFVAYIRVSTYYEEKISPDIQRSSIKAWADRNGAEIVEWIEDLDVSGRKTKRRIADALKWVEDRNARGIAGWRYSRYGRARHGNAANLARLESLGGRLAPATEAAH